MKKNFTIAGLAVVALLAAAHHLGEKFVDLPFQLLESRKPKLGPQVHFKTPKSAVFIAQTTTGTDIDIRDLAPSNIPSPWKIEK